MTEMTKENMLDTFAAEAMKALIARRDVESRDAYRLAGDAYIIADRMLEHRQKILHQWALVNDVEQHGIEKLNLTIRTERCLKAEGILTIQHLQSCTERRLMRVSNLGRKSLNEIIEQMAALGYTLRDYT
jgi:DNA-directed RNA polymerase alpha subunit